MNEAEAKFVEWLSRWKRRKRLEASFVLCALVGCASAFLVLAFELLFWLRIGYWPRWSLLRAILLFPGGSQIQHWHSTPAPWLGLQSLASVLLRLPLWLWIFVITGGVVKLIGFVERPAATWEVITVVKMHAFLIDGRLERFDRTLVEAEEILNKYTAEGKVAVYLFGADSEPEFARRWEGERSRSVVRTV